MIELVLKAIDRIIELARIREKRLAHRFEKLHKPAFDDLQAIHSDYLSLFTRAAQTLRGIGRGPAVRSPYADVSELGDRVEFERIRFEAQRRKLVQLESGKGWSEEENAFLQKLLDYLSLNPTSIRFERYSISGEFHEELQKICLALQDNSPIELETSCGNCFLQQNEHLLDSIAKDCDLRLRVLREKWSSVSGEFQKLQAYVAGRTS